MPHLVANFLRTAGPIPHIKSVSLSRPRNGSRSSNSCSPSRNASPHPSDGDGRHAHAVKMPDLVEAVKRHHLLPRHFGRSLPRDHHHARARAQPSGPVVIECSFESPPIFLHGSPDDSSGALISGQLFLDVKEDAVDVETFSASLSMVVTQKRPFQSNCADCQIQTTELEAWKIISHPTSLCRGKHAYPFSVLLGGQHSASMDSPIVSIAYAFRAVASMAPCSPPGPASSSPPSPIKFERTLDVKRSLPEALYPHHSVRVFPPTNIKASASYDPVIYPRGSNTIILKLDGLLTPNEHVKTVDMWKMKKITWKLEETIKTVAPACEKHNPGAADSAAKGLPRSESRIIGEQEIQSGWKSDYTGNDGTVDVEFDINVNKFKPNSNELKYACDTKTGQGTEVTHSLQLELIISKEYSMIGKTHMSHQTGTGRILRMHYAVVLTDNAGQGISWDDEAPPVYQDVPPSPPGYQCDEAPEYDNLELLDAARSASAPNSRRGSQG